MMPPLVVIEIRADGVDPGGGYIATIVNLDGCVGRGKTVGEAIRNIADVYEDVRVNGYEAVVTRDGFQGWGEHLRKRPRCEFGCTPTRRWYDCPVHGDDPGVEMCPVRVSEDSAGIYRTRCYLVAGHEGKHV